MLQLCIGLFEVLDKVIQRLQHLLNILGHFHGLAFFNAVQSPVGEGKTRNLETSFIRTEQELTNIFWLFVMLCV